MKADILYVTVTLKYVSVIYMKNKIIAKIKKRPLWSQFTILGVLACLFGFTACFVMNYTKMIRLTEETIDALGKRDETTKEKKQISEKLALAQDEINALTISRNKTEIKLKEFNQLSLVLNHKKLSESIDTTPQPTQKNIFRPLKIAVIKSSDYVGLTRLQCKFTNISNQHITSCMGTLVLLDKDRVELGFKQDNIFLHSPDGLAPDSSIFHQFDINIVPGKASHVIFKIDRIL